MAGERRKIPNFAKVANSHCLCHLDIRALLLQEFLFLKQP